MTPNALTLDTAFVSFDSVSAQNLIIHCLPRIRPGSQPITVVNSGVSPTNVYTWETGFPIGSSQLTLLVESSTAQRLNCSVLYRFEPIAVANDPYSNLLNVVIPQGVSRWTVQIAPTWVNQIGVNFVRFECTHAVGSSGTLLSILAVEITASVPPILNGDLPDDGFILRPTITSSSSSSSSPYDGDTYRPTVSNSSAGKIIGIIMGAFFGVFFLCVLFALKLRQVVMKQNADRQQNRFSSPIPMATTACAQPLAYSQHTATAAATTTASAQTASAVAESPLSVPSAAHISLSLTSLAAVHCATAQYHHSSNRSSCRVITDSTPLASHHALQEILDVLDATLPLILRALNTNHDSSRTTNHSRTSSRYHTILKSLSQCSDSHSPCILKLSMHHRS